LLGQGRYFDRDETFPGRQAATFTPHHIASLKLPLLVVWVGIHARDSVSVASNMHRVHRAPNINPFVQQKDVDYWHWFQADV
jgi:hypothetical protein